LSDHFIPNAEMCKDVEMKALAISSRRMLDVGDITDFVRSHLRCTTGTEGKYLGLSLTLGSRYAIYLAMVYAGYLTVYGMKFWAVV